MLLSGDYIILLSDIEGSERLFTTIDVSGNIWEWGVCIPNLKDEQVVYPSQFFRNLAYFHYFEECEI